MAETDLGEERRVCEFIADHPDHHLTCLACGAQVEVPDELLAALRRQVARHYGFALRADHVGLFGYCVKCRRRAAEESQVTGARNGRTFDLPPCQGERGRCPK